MTTEIQDALDVIRDTFAGLTITGQTIQGSWTYPWQMSSISMETLPVTITSMVVGEFYTMAYRNPGTATNSWTSETLVALAEGPLKYPNALSATVEELQDVWVKPVFDAFAADLQLGGTAHFIGRSNRAEHQLLQYWMGHFQWEQKVYWGLRFLIPIVQWYNTTTAP